MSLRPRIALLAAACALVAAAGAAADSSPTIQLVAADVAMAKRITLQKADLGAGWKREASSGASDSNSAGIDGSSGSSSGCHGVELSGYTLTGQAGSTYWQKGADIGAGVGVFATPADATGDLAGTMSPAGRKCIAQDLAEAFDKAVKSGGGSSVRFQMGATKVFRSSTFKALHASHVYAFAISGRIIGPGGSIPLTTSVLAFSKGRVSVFLFGDSTSHEPMQMAPLAKRVLARFPGAWTIEP